MPLHAKKPSKGRKRHQRTAHARMNLQKTPGIFGAYTAFAPVYDLLRDLRSGEANAAQGRIVLRDWEGDYCEAAAALEGLVGCWQRIIEGERLALDLAPLEQLQRFLAAGTMLTEALVDRVTALTDACLAVYKRIPYERLREYSRTEMVAIELDRLGLRHPQTIHQDAA